MNSKKPQLPFAEWIRASAAMMVLLCHLCYSHPNRYFNMAGQILNIGVPIFFLLSGFLFGYGGVKPPYHRWLVKRAKRIYYPMWLFAAVLMVIHVILGIHDSTQNWILMLLGMQGNHVGIQGAIHTWFITPILLCYLATPAIVKIIEWLERRRSPALTGAVVAVACVIPGFLGVLPQAFWIAVYGPIIEFGFAFAAGRYYNRRSAERRKWAIGAACVVVAAFAVRMVGRSLWDGTILYDRLIAWYTHVIAAMGICILFSIFCNRQKVPKPVRTISRYSFEIYLYHHMLTGGPLLMIGLTPFWILDWLAVFAVTMGASVCAQYVLGRIEHSAERLLSGNR